VVVNYKTIPIIVPLDFMSEQGGLEFRHIAHAGLVSAVDLQSFVARGEHAEVRVRVPGDGLDVVEHHQHGLHLECV